MTVHIVNGDDRCVKHRFPHIFLFSGLLLSLIVIPKTGYTADPTPEKSTPEKEATEKIQPHYRIRQLLFTGNKHLNEKKLANLFGWEQGKAYSRDEIIEGFERILDAYRKDGFAFVEMVLDIEPMSEKTDADSEAYMVISIKIVEGNRFAQAGFHS